MRRSRARSENSKVGRRLRSVPVAGGTAAAEKFGSRLFALRAPPPASMPALRSRRQTRALVAKVVDKAGVGASDVGRKVSRSKVLRCGKRRQDFSEPQGKPVVGEDEWVRVFGGSKADDVKCWDGNNGEYADLGVGAPSTPETDAARVAPVVEDSAESEDRIDSTANNRFGIVYFRKRLRRECSDDSDAESVLSPAVETLFLSRMCAKTYKRKWKKLKVSPLRSECELVKGKREYGRGLMISDSTMKLTNLIGISEDDILTSLFGRMVLIVLVVSCHNDSSQSLPYILRIARSWMNRARFSLSDLTAHLLTGSVASDSSEYGVHLLPLKWRKDLVLPRNSQPSCGLCKIYGASRSVPLLCLDFLALPSYFKWLHTSMLLGSLYLPCTLMRYLACWASSLHGGVKFQKDALQVSVGTNAFSAFPTNKKQPMGVIIAQESIVQDGLLFSGSRLRKLQRKRSSSRRHTRNWNPSLFFQVDAEKQLSSGDNTGIIAESKMVILPELLVDPRYDSLETSGDFNSHKDENDVSAALGGHEMNPANECLDDPIKEKELKCALAEVKQNILSACCKANVLVNAVDKCWREEGFEVTLDVSISNDWRIAVKSQGTLRYFLKPQDMKPCVVNRFTRAYMWQGEEGWKLEFPERWDWYVFKELHLECRKHNIPELSSHAIPVPGVCEVAWYEDYTMTSFVRPDKYIRMSSDEVQRALESEVLLYDMDSADEDWLNKFNSIPVISNGTPLITEDDFEKIICTFEKDAYSNMNDIFDRERILELYQDFEKADALSSIYNYWIKKRSKRHGSLMRVFQDPPVRKLVAHKPHIRKTRSFKRQQTESSRTKHESPKAVRVTASEDIGENQKDFQRIQDAEYAANRAMETAIQLRSRAQMLMKHAELAAYKSFMALRIAEAFQASESPNSASILD